MVNIFTVARKILHDKGEMSTWKLQKLCYYSQAWSLAWTNAPLFPEDFQAWRNGPVCPELFHIHQGKFMIGEDGISKSLESSVALTEDETDTINRVLEYYGDWQPYELREQTHCESPWIVARGNIPSDAACSNVITKSSMGEYYGSL